MGRKKKEFGVKEKRVYFRVSEALHEAITCSAKKNGLSVSEFCRLALINHPIEKQPIIIHDERKILQELRNINSVIVKSHVSQLNLLLAGSFISKMRKRIFYH